MYTKAFVVPICPSSLVLEGLVNFSDNQSYDVTIHFLLAITGSRSKEYYYVLHAKCGVNVKGGRIYNTPSPY